MSPMPHKNTAIRLIIALAATLTVTACGRSATKEQYVTRGDGFMAQKKISEAIIEYRRALAEDQRFTLARHKLAQAYSQTGNVPQARAEYIRAADLEPGNVEYQLDAARALLAVGEFEDARTRATAALKIDAKNADAQVVRGLAMAGQRDYSSAITEVEQGVTADPTKAANYLNLGSLRASLGQRTEAEAAFKRAIELNPKSPVAQLALGNFYWAVGRVE